MRSLPLLALALILLSGCCSPAGCGSQSNPICSWTTNVPQNGDALCAAVFKTLQSIVNAQIRGDDGRIRALVQDPAVARRIIVNGDMLRRQHILSLHVVPSFTLEQRQGGELGVAMRVVGETKQGTIRQPETVYVRMRNGRALIVGDQPAQEW